MDQKQPLAENEWNDKSLVDDWAVALKEYRVRLTISHFRHKEADFEAKNHQIYHSIQARGGTLEEAEDDLKALRFVNDARPLTHPQTPFLSFSSPRSPKLREYQ